MGWKVFAATFEANLLFHLMWQWKNIPLLLQHTFHAPNKLINSVAYKEWLCILVLYYLQSKGCFFRNNGLAIYILANYHTTRKVTVWCGSHTEGHIHNTLMNFLKLNSKPVLVRVTRYWKIIEHFFALDVNVSCLNSSSRGWNKLYSAWTHNFILTKFFWLNNIKTVYGYRSSLMRLCYFDHTFFEVQHFSGSCWKSIFGVLLAR